MEYSFILCSSMLFEENILLSLKVWLYGMLYFKCGGWAEAQCRYGWVSVGFWYTCVDVTHRILYHLSIKKVHGNARDFVRESNQWYHAVKIFYK